jgi:invasion protein IalB
MVFAKLVKAATFGAAAGMALTLGVTAGMAQGKDKPTPVAAAPGGAQGPVDIWYKLCMDVPTPEPTKPGEQPKPQKPEEMKKTNVCLTQVDVRDQATALLIGKLLVRQISGQPKPQLVVMLPLQSNLPAGALVKVDDKEPIKLAYTTCDQIGCYAEAVIEPATVDQMKTGKQIAYLGMHVSGQAVSIPLPLEGFAKAIDGAPVPIEKYTEDQRKIAEIIRQRLTELRQKQEAAQAAAQQGQTAPAATPPATPAPKKK